MFTLTFHPRNHAVKSIILKNREHLCDIERNDKDASKQVAKHFNLPYHSKQHLVVCGLSLNQGYSESRKTLRKKFSFKLALLIPTVLTSAFHSTNLFLFSRNHNPTTSAALDTHNFYSSSDEGLTGAQNVSFETFQGGQFTLSTQLIILNYPVILSH